MSLLFSKNFHCGLLLNVISKETSLKTRTDFKKEVKF